MFIVGDGRAPGVGPGIGVGAGRGDAWATGCFRVCAGLGSTKAGGQINVDISAIDCSSCTYRPLQPFLKCGLTQSSLADGAGIAHLPARSYVHAVIYRLSLRV